MAILQPPARANDRPRLEPIELDALSADPLILVPDECGLTAFTVALVADNEIPVQRYSGEAASYQVLEEWTRLGLGAAVLPVSKLTTSHHRARALQHDGRPVLISYEAAWRTGASAHAALAPFVEAIATAGA